MKLRDESNEKSMEGDWGDSVLNVRKAQLDPGAHSSVHSDRVAVPDRPATMRQVAKVAGVSIASVSRAIQTPQLLRSDTLERITAAIAKLGYTPNVQAINLRTSKTRLIIAIVPDIGNPFFSQVVRGIEKIAQDNGYSVLLGDTAYDPWREERYFNFIRSRQADGLITLLPNVPVSSSERRIPIVNACECVQNSDVTTVSVDNFHGAFAATHHLLELGHRHIAFVRGRRESPLSMEREAGFLSAMSEGGLTFCESLIAEGDFSMESGVRAVNGLIASGRKFTAIFCSNDEMAIGAFNALRLLGLRVPEDISVVGFDDIHISRYLDPPLTTVAQPMLEIGTESAKLLIEILQKGDAPIRKRILPTQLVKRASTGPVRVR